MNLLKPFRAPGSRAIWIAAWVALGIAGCTRRDEDEKLIVGRLAIADDVKTLDPANAYDAVSLDVMPSIYEALYQYSYLSDTVKVEPLLAADMPKFSADRLTLTIPIKHGIRFQDDPCFKNSGGKGREVKAQDFVYSFKRIALPSLESQGWWIFDGKIVGINAFHDKLAKTAKTDLDKVFDGPVEGFQALDDYTLRIKLIKPYPELMYILTMGFTTVVPREAVKAYADEQGNLTDHPVGTGPYMLKSWKRNSGIILERNPNFHHEWFPSEASADYRNRGMLADAGKTLPFVDKFVISIEKEQQPRWLSFMKGGADFVTIPKDNFNQAIINKTNLTPEMTAKGVRLTIETGQTFYYVSFNMNDKLIGGNKYLRQALSSAIDRNRWIETFTDGTGIKMTTAFPPGIPDRVRDPALKYDFNLERAKELLKKAGYPNGQGLPPLNFDMRGADTLSRQIGDFFAQQWAQIGVKLNVILNTFPAYLEKAKKGDLQISYGGWNMDYPDGENIFQILYGPNKSPGPNEANFDNPEFNKMYGQMAIMESGPKRAVIVKKMDDLIQEEVPWAYGYYYAQYDLSQPWLQNYRTDAVIQNRLKYFRVDKETKKRYLSQK